MNCNVVACEKLAEYYPVFLIRPKNYRGTPARATVKLPLCEEHAKAKDAEEFMTEQLWNMIKGGILKLGRQAPHRSSTEIEFVYIEGKRWETDSLFIFDPAKTDN